jgi:hypothetical protein
MLNCEGIISKDECVSAIRTFKNGKSPGTDGLHCLKSLYR